MEQPNMRVERKPFKVEHDRQPGFTVVELLVAMVIILIVAGIAVPQFLSMMHAAKLRGAVSDYASIVQVQRLRAVNDDRFYSTYVLPANGINQAFVDIYPQQNNGASGTNGQAYTCGAAGCDPLVILSREVARQPALNAPNTANLQAQVLPANSPVVMQDGGAQATPTTFGPRGLPCTPFAVVGGNVCDSLGGPTAYWVFFQDIDTQNWGAVTVTPAGRVRRWIYTAGAAPTWRSF